MHWISLIFRFIVLYSLWSLTTTDRQELNNLLQFFFIYYLVREPLSTGRLGKYMTQAIMRGDINTYLTRPLSFTLAQVIKLFTTIVARSIVPFLIVIIAIFVYPEILAPESLLSGVFFILFMIISTVIWNLIIAIFSIPAFYGTETGHLRTVLDLVLNIFTGALIPAQYYPAQIKEFLTYTPIPYIGYYPIEIYQNGWQNVNLLQGAITAIFWMISLYVLFNILYKKGLRSYEAVGG